jgi:hypothetical protein
MMPILPEQHQVDRVKVAEYIVHQMRWCKSVIVVERTGGREHRDKREIKYLDKAKRESRCD